MLYFLSFFLLFVQLNNWRNISSTKWPNKLYYFYSFFFYNTFTLFSFLHFLCFQNQTYHKYFQQNMHVAIDGGCFQFCFVSSWRRALVTNDKCCWAIWGDKQLNLFKSLEALILYSLVYKDKVDNLVGFVPVKPNGKRLNNLRYLYVNMVDGLTAEGIYFSSNFYMNKKKVLDK